MSVKKSSDSIENRTRDLLAFSAMPQLTAPRRAPPPYLNRGYNTLYLEWFVIRPGVQKS